MIDFEFVDDGQWSPKAIVGFPTCRRGSRVTEDIEAIKVGSSFEGAVDKGEDLIILILGGEDGSFVAMRM